MQIVTQSKKTQKLTKKLSTSIWKNQHKIKKKNNKMENIYKFDLKSYLK